MKIIKLLFMFLILINIIKNTSASEISNRAYIKSIIIETSLKSNYVTPSLALAVAQVESNFNPNAVSSKGAIGVMQIMPRTALYEYGITKERLFNPETNIKIGIKFLNHLITKYNGRVDIALSHYNGGSAVGKWPNLQIIPATYNYVIKVLKISEKNKSNFFKNQKYVNLKNKEFKKRTNLDKNIQDIDRWLNIYKKLKRNEKKRNQISKISMKYNNQYFNYMGTGTLNFSFR